MKKKPTDLLGTFNNHVNLRKFGYILKHEVNGVGSTWLPNYMIVLCLFYESFTCFLIIRPIIGYKLNGVLMTYLINNHLFNLSVEKLCKIVIEKCNLLNSNKKKHNSNKKYIEA
jgi:hypothetical protein